MSGKRPPRLHRAGPSWRNVSNWFKRRLSMTPTRVLSPEVRVPSYGSMPVVARASDKLRSEALASELMTVQVIGRGDYGAVWSSGLNPSTGGGGHGWIVKVSNLDRCDERIDGYHREVYFLKRLQGTSLVPQLARAEMCQQQGIQVMEQFEGSFQDLGAQQAKLFKLPANEVALTEEQIYAVVDLVLAFDRHKIVHGDLKRGNILQRDKARKVVLADFGFSGTSGSSPYEPLIGFTRHYGCPAQVKVESNGKRVLKVPIPAHLLPFMNRWQIYSDFVGGRLTWIIPKKSSKGESLRSLDKKALARALGLDRGTLRAFRKYCSH